MHFMKSLSYTNTYPIPSVRFKRRMRIAQQRNYIYRSPQRAQLNFFSDVPRLESYHFDELSCLMQTRDLQLTDYRRRCRHHHIAADDIRMNISCICPFYAFFVVVFFSGNLHKFVLRSHNWISHALEPDEANDTWQMSSMCAVCMSCNVQQLRVFSSLFCSFVVGVRRREGDGTWHWIDLHFRSRRIFIVTCLAVAVAPTAAVGYLWSDKCMCWRMLTSNRLRLRHCEFMSDASMH